MTDLFDAIITGEQVEHGKPDPEIYEMACDAIGVTAGLSFAVEDSPNGIRSAAAANLRVIMVPDLVKPNLELRELVVTVQETCWACRSFWRSSESFNHKKIVHFTKNMHNFMRNRN